MTAPVNQAPSGISSSPGGGVAPGAVTLQLAYDNGPTIVEGVGGPVVLQATDAVLLQVEQTTSSPPGDQGAIEVRSTGDTTNSATAFLVRAIDAGNPQVRTLRVFGPSDEQWLELRPDGLYFLVPLATQPYAFIIADQGKRFCIQTGRADIGLGSTAGDLKMGPEFGPNDTDGGVVIEGNTGRVRVDCHALGATIADDRRGAFEWPRVSTGLDNATECDPPAEGDSVLRREDIGELSYRTKGFRGYRAGAWGLFMRGYSRDFDNGLLVGADLTVVHDLDTQAPLVQLYEDQGAGYVLVNAGPTTFSVFTPDADTTLVTFDAGMLPLANSWKITIGGF